MTLPQHTHNQSRGFSLLELLLVVGVGAVLILAGLSAYRLVSEGNATTQGIRQLQILKQQVQEAFRGETGYGSTAGANLLATLQAMRMLPTDMTPNATTGATTLRNEFSSTTTVVTGALVAGQAASFIVTFNGVPASSCNKLGMSFSTANASDFVRLSVGTITITTPTVATLATACANATNTLAWEFR